MKCPLCGHGDTSVIDSRITREGREIRRRRACQNEECKHRFTTYERLDERVVFIVKKDKRREPLSRSKLAGGLRKACEKLAVASGEIDRAVMSIVRKIHDLNVDEIDSSFVGDLVMEALFDLDEVAYIRFSSVYLRFQDISQFTSHINELRSKKKREATLEKRKTAKLKSS